MALSRSFSPRKFARALLLVPLLGLAVNVAQAAASTGRWIVVKRRWLSGRIPTEHGIFFRTLERLRTEFPGPGCPVECPADRWRQRDLDDLAALAAHAQYPVAVLLAEVSDVRASGLEDPQAEQPEHGHQGEVVRVR